MIDIETRTKIMVAVRAALHTKWKHQGRHIGLGVDCIGVALLGAVAAGEDVESIKRRIPNYGTIPHNNRFYSFMQENLLQITEEAILPGDMALICWKSYPMHIAVIGDAKRDMSMEPPFSIIHANAALKMVSEQPLDPTIKVHGYYRLPGLAAREAQ